MADRLAPDVLALDERLGPLADATARLESLPLDGLLTYLIDTVPAAWLPELGRQFHIMPLEGWQFATSDADRRRLIRESIALHRKKGTSWAVKRALQIAGFGGQHRITEGRIAAATTARSSVTAPKFMAAIPGPNLPSTPTSAKRPDWLPAPPHGWPRSCASGCRFRAILRG